MNQKLTVRDYIAMLSLLDQDALVCRYYPGNNEFIPLEESDISVIETKTDGDVIANDIIVDSEPAKQISIVCINSGDIEEEAASLFEEMMRDGLEYDVETLEDATNALSEAVNALQPYTSEHRLTNVHALAAFNKVKAASIEMLANSVNLMNGLVEVVNKDLQFQEEKQAQEGKEFLESLPPEGEKSNSNVYPFPASDNNAGGGAA